MTLRQGSSTSTTGGGPRRAALVREEDRRSIRSGVVAEGSLACATCDAPVAPGPDPLPLGAELTCPFCGRRAAVRDFLSLSRPTRPARVTVRLSMSRQPA